MMWPEIWIICDLCGKKVKRSQSHKITYKYDVHYGNVVCTRCTFKANPGNEPVNIRERPVAAPDLLRPRDPVTYEESIYNDRLPGPPRFITPVMSPVEDAVLLYWTPPENPGSGRITGYSIKRAHPQNMTLSVIVANTGSDMQAYTDLTALSNLTYIYQVAAINAAGTGPYSDPGYYPTYLPDDGKFFICLSDGRRILLSDTSQRLYSFDI